MNQIPGDKIYRKGIVHSVALTVTLLFIYLWANKQHRTLFIIFASYPPRFLFGEGRREHAARATRAGEGSQKCGCDWRFFPVAVRNRRRKTKGVEVALLNNFIYAGAHTLLLRGAALIQHILYQVSRGALGVGAFVVVYKVLRALFRQGGSQLNGLQAFVAGGAASFITLYYHPSTTNEILLYCLKLLLESVPQELTDKGLLKPPPYLYSLINLITIGLFFFYYETREKYLKPMATKGIKGLLGDN